MQTRTWNLKLMATDDHPETTLAGVSQDEAARILRGLMYGARSSEYAHVERVFDARASERVAA